MASRAFHPEPLSPSLSDNTRTYLSNSEYAPQATLLQNALSQDENIRPASPAGMTFAEEMARSGESVRRQGKPSSLGNLGETDGAFTLPGFVGEKDITEIEIDVPYATSASDSGFRMEPLSSDDIVSSQTHVDVSMVLDFETGEDGVDVPVLLESGTGQNRVDVPMILDSQRAPRSGDHTTELDSIPQNVSDAAGHSRPLVRGSHTLRERRMTYLRDMYAILDQPQPDVPRAILRATSTLRRTKWEIEAGVVGKHPKRKLPAFVTHYRGSPYALLHQQRQLIFEEVQKKDGGKLGSLLHLEEPEVPQSVGEEPSHRDDVHRMEIEEMLRSANIAADDLDEADMAGVVGAVLSAAAEAARLATASF